MTRLLPSLLVSILCLAFAAAEEGLWMTDFKAAVEKAGKEKKPLILDFTGSDWCGWCIKLKKEVFDTQEFQDWAKDKVVLVELDFPSRKKQDAALKQQNEALQKQYDIQGYPTIIVLDPTGTKQLGKLRYMRGGPQPWIAQAEKVLATGK
jgi:thioredoxin-related protein